MAENDLDTNEAPEQAPLAQRVRAWTAAHPKRAILVGAGLGAVTAVTLAAWIVLSALTAPRRVTTIEDALTALDNGDLEYAEELVLQIQAHGDLDHTEIGGPLFVLGAVKAALADQEFSPEHRRRDYLVASGYLSKAHEAGFPPERDHEGLYLLGKSLIKSNQLTRGVEALEDALAVDPDQVEDIHRLIAEAHFNSEEPLYEIVLKHIDLALATTELKEPVRSEALILKAHSLAAIDRYDEAFQTLSPANPAGGPARKLLVECQLRVQQLRQMEKAPGGQAIDSEPIIAKTEALLKKVWTHDKLATSSGAANYLSAQLARVQGQNNRAIQLFEEVQKTHGDEPEGIASAMAEGRLLQQLGEHTDALNLYRAALLSIDDPLSYRNELLPLSKLRTQLLAAHSSFISEGSFPAAAELVGRLHPIFSRNKQLELKADTYQKWGENLLRRAETDPVASEQLKAEGRARLREAGVNYELLAGAIFATKHYPAHLWRSTEAYFRGQSYSSALRTVRDYLRHEPQQHNALALLRLGQTRRGMDDQRGAIEAFQECIEFHPLDAATYSARLECAKACRDIGDAENARKFLNQNLVGSALSPRSPEWKDSKYELGRLLHENQDYHEAIRHLEEAVLRYPDDPQTMLARYLIAEAYRHSAKAPLELYAKAKTVNERERNRDDVVNFLDKAVKNYEVVRREIAMQAGWSNVDRAMIRNCYMFKGAVLYDRGVLEQEESARAKRESKDDLAQAHELEAQNNLAGAVQAYSDLSAQFQDEPVILEVLVQIAHCWRRLDDREKAWGYTVRALGVLDSLPPGTDFASTTNLSRNEWESMLKEMETW